MIGRPRACGPRIARGEIEPISDVRGSLDFRLILAENVLLRSYFNCAGIDVEEAIHAQPRPGRARGYTKIRQLSASTDPNESAAGEQVLLHLAGVGEAATVR